MKNIFIIFLLGASSLVAMDHDDSSPEIFAPDTPFIPSFDYFNIAVARRSPSSQEYVAESESERDGSLVSAMPESITETHVTPAAAALDATQQLVIPEEDDSSYKDKRKKARRKPGAIRVGGRFPCHLCGKVLKWQHGLKEHLRDACKENYDRPESSRRAFPCNIGNCVHVAIRPRDLKYHQMHHSRMIKPKQPGTARIVTRALAQRSKATRQPQFQ